MIETHEKANPTSAEMRLFPRFLRQTPVGDCTSSEEVPDAWSLSPSDPIFRFSWTISGLEERAKRGWVPELDRWGRSGRNGTKMCSFSSSTNKSNHFRSKQGLSYRVGFQYEAWPWESPGLLRSRSGAGAMAAFWKNRCTAEERSGHCGRREDGHFSL